MTRLDDIRARADAATPGLWVYKTSALSLAAVFAAPGMVAGCGSGEAADRDAEFIAHARTDIPDLLDAIEAKEFIKNLAEAALRKSEMRFVKVEAILQAVLDLHPKGEDNGHYCFVPDLGRAIHFDGACPTRRIIEGTEP